MTRNRWEQWLRTELARFDPPDGVDTVTGFAVAMMCATYARPDGTGITVSSATLERQLRVGRRRIGAALRWLDEIGILTQLADHGRGTAARRRLSIPNDDGAVCDTVTPDVDGAVCDTVSGINDGVDQANDGVDHGFDGVDMPTPEQVNQNRSSNSRSARPRERRPSAFDEAVAIVHNHLAAEFGKEFDRRDIRDTVAAFLHGRTVTNVAAYIRKSVEDNPAQFLPTPGPPRYRREAV